MLKSRLGNFFKDFFPTTTTTTTTTTMSNIRTFNFSLMSAVDQVTALLQMLVQTQKQVEEEWLEEAE
jgi:hypothetical protein